ncbi:hypothetical protein RFI_19764 [Reticulomyxa filosa]|uniref:Uncharacterized protein n=1 Tax=Reticulomyxa filosa TaxID=46433 RepID=X6MVS2_RETFI|nr:hypothetical protein RFI_19764 [Reticulomyxa filosa]|eukprot:ETO17557.1 hypothetical protein RFI_19764 [Reticulomyxa filosa]
MAHDSSLLRRVHRDELRRYVQKHKDILDTISLETFKQSVKRVKPDTVLTNEELATMFDEWKTCMKRPDFRFNDLRELDFLLYHLGFVKKLSNLFLFNDALLKQIVDSTKSKGDHTHPLVEALEKTKEESVLFTLSDLVGEFVDEHDNTVRISSIEEAVSPLPEPAPSSGSTRRGKDRKKPPPKKKSKADPTLQDPSSLAKKQEITATTNSLHGPKNQVKPVGRPPSRKQSSAAKNSPQSNVTASQDIVCQQSNDKMEYCFVWKNHHTMCVCVCVCVCVHTKMSLQNH